MGPRELRASRSPSAPAGAIQLLEESLHGHFSRISCAEHVRSLDIAFETSPTELVGTLRACCSGLDAQLATHEFCARELAAMLGLELCWGQAA